MHRRTFLSGALASASLPSLAQADQVADFYRGRTITCYIGYASGGGYDIYARVISRFMQKHLPGNPNIIAVNMPGASSMTLGNHLAKVAPRDGTVEALGCAIGEGVEEGTELVTLAAPSA